MRSPGILAAAILAACSGACTWAGVYVGTASDAAISDSGSSCAVCRDDRTLRECSDGSLVDVVCENGCNDSGGTARCNECTPGTNVCGPTGTVHECDPDGTVGAVIDTCMMSCLGGQCDVDPITPSNVPSSLMTAAMGAALGPLDAGVA